MKLATLKTGGRDGRLIIVSRDLKRAVAASEVAPSLQAVLDDYRATTRRLTYHANTLASGRVKELEHLTQQAIGAWRDDPSLLAPGGDPLLADLDNVGPAARAGIPEATAIGPNENVMMHMAPETRWVS